MFLISAHMGGMHGTAKSARDFLRAMLVNEPGVYVLSPDRETFPEVMCGRTLSHPRWLNPQDILRLGRFWQICPGFLRNFIPGDLPLRPVEWIARDQVVIVNGWASHAFWKEVANRFTGTRVLVVRESPRHFSGPDLPLKMSDLLQALAGFDELIFVSDRVRQEWLKFDALKNKPSHLLPNCCEEEDVETMRRQDRQAIRAAFGFGPEEFVILSPGSIEHRKGQDLLAGIVPELAKHIDSLRVMFVGNIGTAWGQELVQQITQGEPAQWCRHLDSRPDILDLLYASDVLAFPSRAEALPRTILEAMAMGTPLVASAVDGIPELIEHGRSGLLIPSDSKTDLFSGLLAVFQHPEHARERADRARTRYWDHFSRTHQFDRMAKILKQMGPRGNL